jgi:membrane-bound inhibitor of C-type lysozyme
MIEYFTERYSLKKVVLDKEPVTFGNVRIDAMGSKYANILNKSLEKGNFEIINKTEEF